MTGTVSASSAAGLLRAAAADVRQALPGAAATPTCQAVDDVAVLLLADVAGASRLWGWSRIVLGARPLRGVPGLRLAKALGSGHDGGFGLRPSASRQGLFALFGSEAEADAFLQTNPIPKAYAARSREFLSLKLRATSSRGAWGGAPMAATAPAPTRGPVAALTRASIRPSRAWDFWAHSPASERALQDAPGCLLAVGLGEAPVLRQATFSLWESQAAMDAYARSGPHLQAIRAATAGGWFSESMFVRFLPLEVQGRWLGRPYG
jgi:quinol monooxygenase YgiN